MSDTLAIPYITETAADVYNSNHVGWDNAETADRNDALFFARMYIDSRYKFIVSFDETDAHEAIKRANAILATRYLDEITTFFNLPSKYGLSEIRVRADVVESKKKFHSSFLGASLDKYPDITAILFPYAIFSSGAGSHNLIRQ